MLTPCPFCQCSEKRTQENFNNGAETFTCRNLDCPMYYQTLSQSRIEQILADVPLFEAYKATSDKLRHRHTQG